jgi:hypothetical protein
VTSAWSKLSTLRGALGVKAAWGDFPAQFLAPVEALAAAIPCDHGHVCQLGIVEHAPDDVVGVCSNEDGLCEKRQVARKERVVFRLYEQRLFDAIISAVGGKIAPLEEIAARPRVLRIGGIPTTGDAQIPAFFALAANLAATDAAVTTLLAHGTEKFLLVVPEEKSIGIVQQNRAGQRRAKIIGLDQLLEVGETGAVSARASGQEALNAWVGTVAPAAARDAEAARFPTPPGTAWKDVTITFNHRDIVEIKCRGATALSKERLHIPGMANATTRLKSPTDSWVLLMAFAARGPALPIAEIAKLFGTYKPTALRKKVSDLNSDLKSFFGIDHSAIQYDRKQKHYLPALVIREDTNTDLEDWLSEK